MCRTTDSRTEFSVSIHRYGCSYLAPKRPGTGLLGCIDEGMEDASILMQTGVTALTARVPSIHTYVSIIDARLPRAYPRKRRKKNKADKRAIASNERGDEA